MDLLTREVQLLYIANAVCAMTCSIPIAAIIRLLLRRSNSLLMKSVNLGTSLSTKGGEEVVLRGLQ